MKTVWLKTENTSLYMSKSIVGVEYHSNNNDMIKATVIILYKIYFFAEKRTIYAHMYVLPYICTYIYIDYEER